MHRINEGLAFQNVLAPQSVSAETDTTSAYVDLSGVEEAVFLISTAALGAGKSSGSDAEEIGEAVFTDAVGTAPQLAVVSCRPSAAPGRYAAVKFQHDGAAAVICGVAAACKGRCLPAENGWTLAV